MPGINYGRVAIGGLAAGVVINLSELVLNGVILADDYAAMMDVYGLSEADWAIGGYVASSLILAFVVAWLYAAIRPRFGMGWRTGVMAGLAVWLTAYAVPGIWFSAMGMVLGSQGLLALSLVWSMAEMALAGIAAGWIYREGGSPSIEEPPVA